MGKPHASLDRPYQYEPKKNEIFPFLLFLLWKETGQQEASTTLICKEWGAPGRE